MNVNEIELHGGIHTLFVIGNRPDNSCKVEGLTMERPILNEGTGEVLHGARVNPNKYLLGENGYINSFGQFCTTLDEMMSCRGFEYYKVQRIDFRIDNYNNYFGELYKLNNITINLLASRLGIQNCYKSLKNDIPHNIIARGSGEEIECYDRIKKDGCGLTKTRIELRNIFPYITPVCKEDIPQICKRWTNNFNTRFMPVLYSDFQAKQNERIICKYKTAINSRNNTIDILARNQNYICTSGQMGVLCDELNLAKNVCYTYKNRIGIDYYKYKDIEKYLKKIVLSLQEFMNA